MNFDDALYYLAELEKMIEGNSYQNYLYSHLFSIQTELQRQQFLTKSQNSPKLEE
jgi:hypothetical protein